MFPETNFVRKLGILSYIPPSLLMCVKVSIIIQNALKVGQYFFEIHLISIRLTSSEPNILSTTYECINLTLFKN